VRAELRGGALDISGDLGVSVGAGRLGKGSSADSLGLERSGYVEPRLGFDWERWHAQIGGFTTEFKGTGTTQTALGIGPVIGVNNPVDTEVNISMITADGIYDLIKSDVVDVGLGAGVGWFLYDLQVQSLSSPARVNTGNDVPLVFLAGRLAKDVGRFELRLEGKGIYLDTGGEKISFYDADARAGYRLIDAESWGGIVSLGWRFLGVDYEYTDLGARVFADLDFNGPYLSFIAEF